MEYPHCSQFESLLKLTVRFFARQKMPRKSHKKQDPVKGKPIRFVRGTYQGLEGWVDKANKASKKSGQIWVIVDDVDYKEEIHTQVLRTYIQNERSTPSSWAEAAVEQHPKLDESITNLAFLLASFNVSTYNESCCLTLIATEVDVV